jgi:hypothetical protein
MRIGLITHHWVPNFGANLQALSTFNYLTKMGYDVIILNYRRKALEELYSSRVRAEQVKVHNEFCDTYLRQSPLFRSAEEITEFCNEIKFNVIVSGSDAIFRLGGRTITDEGKFPNPFWLAWAHSGLNPKPRTGFLAGSSAGANFYSFGKSLRRDIRHALRQVDYISVRDRWTRLMLVWLSLGRLWPKMCPDPVSMLNDVFEVPDSYTREPASFHRKYILLSVPSKWLPEDWVREFIAVAHKSNLEVFSLPLPEGEVQGPVDRVINLPMPPLLWYAWIQHSAGFVGVRFHPVACSIFNNVPFVSLDSYGLKPKGIKLHMSSKTYDLCKNIAAGSRRIPIEEIRKCSPRKVLALIQNWDCKRVKKYHDEAKRRFAETIDCLLGTRPISREGNGTNKPT